MAEIDDRPGQAAADLDSPQLYVNRELALIEFQRRVLGEADDPAVPLLERVRFLSIFGSNMDEFFMIRLAGLKQQVAAGVQDTGPDGMTPAEQLAAVRRMAEDIQQHALRIWRDRLVPALDSEGIRIVDYDALSIEARIVLRSYFETSVFPVLTPLAVDPSRPFPHISNLSLNLAVVIRDPAGHEHFARVKVPGTLPSLVPVPQAPDLPPGTFVPMDRLIAANLDALFPGEQILEVHPFRVTRNADFVIQELEAGDLLETIEESIRQRQFGFVTRLTYEPTMPARILDDLLVNLEADRADAHVVDGPLEIANLVGLYALDRPDLKDPPFLPALPRRLEAKEPDVFAAVRSGDILLHHPFDSFAPVLDFLESAAIDPDVLAIKMTLYRVGRNSPVVKALLTAREEGKQVAVLVELKARFDEERNIEWARALESEGVHVVYGLIGLKTHAKVALVVRREGDRIRRYTHLSTGNYNAVTAQQYTDISLLTCGRRHRGRCHRPLQLPHRLFGQDRLPEARGGPHQPAGDGRTPDRARDRPSRAGQSGHIIMKMNALVDRRMIRLLYRASQAGVKVDLIVRGMCSLPPGDSRSERQHPGGLDRRAVPRAQPRVLVPERRRRGSVYMGSADLMPRNLNGRVEALFPICDPRLVSVVREEILGAYLADNVKARAMNADGTLHARHAGRDRRRRERASVVPERASDTSTRLTTQEVS